MNSYPSRPRRLRARPMILSFVLVLSMASLALAEGVPKRLVSTAPSITETLFALGLGDRVVGVSEYCRYPPEAARKPRIGSYLAPNAEVILAMRPDVVFVEEVNARAASTLPEVGFKRVLLRHRSIADIYQSIEKIADAAGEASRGTKLIEEIRRELAAIEARTSKLPKRRVLFLVGRTPGTLQGMVAVGHGTYINELIRIAGGVNAVEDAGPAYPNVSLEVILGRNPEVIIDRGDMSQAEKQNAAHEAEVRKLWQSLPSVEAVKQHRVHAVSDDFWVVPGPRVVDAARALEKLLHPEARR